MQRYSSFSIVTFTIIQKEISLQLETILKSSEVQEKFFQEFRKRLLYDSSFITSLKLQIKDEIKQEIRQEIKHEINHELEDLWEKIDNI